ncbi:alpha/beta-Hydrolases superfamily protein [Euphorbia peplus]|nr:alpha/beta-Hydrolases superfamily protein [Euphorbia peplus]
MATKKCISPRLPLKTRLMLTTFSLAATTSRRSNYTINRSFMKLFDPKSPPSLKPIHNVSSFDIPIDPTQKLWFRLYIPMTTSSLTPYSLPLIVYFHGGGFCFLTADSKQCDQYCRRLAREIPAAVISVNYRLAPENKYPCQYEDGFDALKFIDGMNFDNFSAKVDLEWCFVTGACAGGNLAHNVLLKAIDYKFTNLDIIGLITIQPFFGGEERTESEIWLGGVTGLSVDLADWYWKAFLPEGADRNHPVVNVFGPNAVDISGIDFPATLICIGGYDILQDWQRRYYEGLKKSGKEVYLVEYPKVIHGFYSMSELPESSLLINEMKNFIKKQTDNLLNGHNID